MHTYNPYRCCHCRFCREQTRGRSNVKGFHKRRAHRLFRRRSKEAIARQDDTMIRVSSGYMT